MPVDHRSNMDLITRSRIGMRDLKDKARGMLKTKEEVLGYTFRPGDVVIDKETGEEVIILAGAKAFVKVQTPPGEGA